MCNHNITSTKNQYFIDKSRKIHDEKYDYSLVEYVNAATKVKIICHEHGVFEQVIGNHLRGAGCKSCAINKRSQTQTACPDDVISKFNSVHNNRYDYSLVKYVNAKTKVKIICPEHGIFEQIPHDHLTGSGCKECSKIQVALQHTMSLNEILTKFKSKHNDRYDYSLVEYVNSRTAVKIICSEHGIFEQTPQNHLTGSGCKECGELSRFKKRTASLDYILTQFATTHNDRYDYSLMKYVNSSTKVKIICKEHGIFEQLPPTHIKGAGCPKCKGVANAKRRMLDTDTTVNKFIKKHGNQYDYSAVDYHGCTMPVDVKCHVHGSFKITPYSHLRGGGCPKCLNDRQYSKQSQSWLDSLNIPTLIKEYRIPENKARPVDGYDPVTNTVYQYHGDFFHGNPILYESDRLNPLLKQKFGDLYQKTLLQDQELRDCGYNLVVMWEYDWTNNWKNLPIN